MRAGAKTHASASGETQFISKANETSWQHANDTFQKTGKINQFRSETSRQQIIPVENCVFGNRKSAHCALSSILAFKGEDHDPTNLSEICRFTSQRLLRGELAISHTGRSGHNTNVDL